MPGLSMKGILRRAAGAGVVLGALGMLTLSPASAQSRGSFRRLPQNVQPAYGAGNQPTYHNAAQEAQPYEPPPVNQAPPAVAPAPECPPEEAPPAETPWSLTNLFDDECGCNWMKDNGWLIGGWTQFGYQNNPDGAFTGNGPLLNQREWGRFLLNQQYLFLEKKANGADGFDWGVRGDIMYGVDGNEGQSFGNSPGRFDFVNGFDHGIYEWAIPQLYGEIAYKELSVKIGHFYTPTGYEVIPPAQNFFYSHALTWYHGEAFYHTGALATYTASDKLTLSGGYTFGWDTGFDQINGASLLMFGMAYNFSDKTSLAYFGANGNSGWRGNGGLNGLILSQKWTEKFMTVHQFDVFTSDTGTNFNVDGVAGNDVATVHYAFYDINSWLRGGVRYEWFQADGTSYNTLTYGVNIKPHTNLVVRPEVRHNWAPGAVGGPPGSIASNVEEVFGNSTIFGIDVVLTY